MGKKDRTYFMQLRGEEISERIIYHPHDTAKEFKRQVNGPTVVFQALVFRDGTVHAFDHDISSVGLLNDISSNGINKPLIFLSQFPSRMLTELFIGSSRFFRFDHHRHHHHCPPRRIELRKTGCF